MLNRYTFLGMVITLVLTVVYGQELYTNYSLLRLTEQRVLSLTQQASDAPKTTDSIQRNTKDVTIEIEAEGVKLRMINEATWTSVFKLCFLWFFALGSLAAYKVVTNKYS